MSGWEFYLQRASWQSVSLRVNAIEQSNESPQFVLFMILFLFIVVFVQFERVWVSGNVDQPSASGDCSLDHSLKRGNLRQIPPIMHQHLQPILKSIDTFRRHSPSLDRSSTLETCIVLHSIRYLCIGLTRGHEVGEGVPRLLRSGTPCHCWRAWKALVSN